MGHISRVQLRNYKRFENFTLHTKHSNILVGPNNCGKSSILDAIRILAACIRFAKGRSPQSFSVTEDEIVTGYRIPDGSLPVPIANITKDYSSDDAILDFSHEDGGKLRIRLSQARPTLLYTQTPGRRPGGPLVV